MSNFPPFVTPLAAASFDKINRTKLAAAAVSISFSGIDTNSRMFRVTSYIIMNGAGGGPSIILNNDFTALYDSQRVSAFSSSTAGSRTIATTAMVLFSQLAIDADETGLSVVYIAKQAADKKAVMLEDSAFVEDTINAFMLGGLSAMWNNVADLINRIDLVASTNMDVGTTVLLEGQFKGQPL